MAPGTRGLAHVQQLIAEIVIRFGGVEAGALDETIVDSLRRIGEALQLDRAILWRRNPEEPMAAIATHLVSDHGFPDPRPLTSPHDLEAPGRAGVLLHTISTIYPSRSTVKRSNATAFVRVPSFRSRSADRKTTTSVRSRSPR